MKIIGIGVDVVEIVRIAGSIERHGDRFLRRVFTRQEQQYCGAMKYAAQSYAARFAAKEAALKALGLGLVDGGVLDGTAVTVVSLSPPRLSQADLQLALARIPGGAVAVVYNH